MVYGDRKFFTGLLTGFTCVRIQHGPKSQRVAAGANIDFRCVHEFVPCPHVTKQYQRYTAIRPTIHWLKDGQALTQRHTSPPKYDWGELGASLTIRNVSGRDTGAYTCVAQLDSDVNNYDNKSADLIVEG